MITRTLQSELRLRGFTQVCPGRWRWRGINDTGTTTFQISADIGNPYQVRRALQTVAKVVKSGAFRREATVDWFGEEDRLVDRLTESRAQRAERIKRKVVDRETAKVIRKALGKGGAQ